jgi:hypothetical protein
LDSEGEEKRPTTEVIQPKPDKPVRLSKEESNGARAKVRPSKIPRLIGQSGSSGPSSPTKTPAKPETTTSSKVSPPASSKTVEPSKMLDVSSSIGIDGGGGEETDEFEEEERRMLALESQVKKHRCSRCCSCPTNVNVIKNEGFVSIFMLYCICKQVCQGFRRNKLNDEPCDKPYDEHHDKLDEPLCLRPFLLLLLLLFNPDLMDRPRISRLDHARLSFRTSGTMDGRKERGQ